MRDGERSPRAAIVLPESPLPADTGASLRSLQVATMVEGLGFSVTLLCVRPRAGSVPAPWPIQLLSTEAREVGESIGGRIRRKLSYLGPGNDRNPFAWWTVPYDLARAIPEALRSLDPDVVVVHSLLLDQLPAIRRTGRPIVVDCHNADIHLAREMVRVVPWWRAPGPWANYAGVRTVTRRHLPSADEVWCVSADDAERIRRDVGIDAVVVPCGVDQRDAAAAPLIGRDDECAVIANYRYGPNLNGVRWLIRDVWPEVRRLRPHARLTLVGDGAESELRALAAAPGVLFRGHAPDLAPIYADAAALLAPLFEGGGTRLKIVEAWKYGKAVVTTPKGIEGIPFPDGIADVCPDAESFARAVAAIIADSGRRERVGRGALTHVVGKLSYAAIGEGLRDRSIMGRALTSTVPAHA